MSLRRSLASALGVVLLGLGLPLATPSGAAADPCGFYKTGSDAFYNHCTSDGSNVVIEVEVRGPNYERCVGPGRSWLGSSGRINGAFYTGRTC
ncbi:hypothetical protein TU94_01015 [Streptomyces cyaneogriseus subsp. noncyanogenus]|jgi:hypothetical protein|uniref:Secreted protein n=1 Tax=Streptomyces cyaneogriseus subsp. noncyanogenus TaxID=477245 RepID=A0A0C5FKR5_9ACTN|nr:DUF6355 family natural product biosynthesis protein [Streptomyces cyaneogriseus]AJP00332.1 hypothetical protein TU94_01015 [Streptomyces cyaneogriseus subsp. noncyanogenus]